MLRVLFVCCVLLSAVGSMKRSIEKEGYPSGLMSDCPGTEKKVIITKKSLSRLSLTIQGKGPIWTARKKVYNFLQANEILNDPDFDLRRKTIIYAGGYLDSSRFPFGSMMIKSYKDLGYNGMVLDNSWFTSQHYTTACRNIRPVGLQMARILASWTQRGLDPKRVELIGLSLGAHTISYIAKNYRLLTGMNISRLTGLDPAGPCFRNLPESERLDLSDADFVDMVSTNIDNLGMATPVGHVNFIVNGGENQPGDLEWTMCFSLCSHVRSYTLWVSALQNPNKFIGLKCDSVQQARERDCYERVPLETNVLGLQADKNKLGIFYLSTDHKFPYYLGTKGLKRENDFWPSHLSMLNNDEVIKL